MDRILVVSDSHRLNFGIQKVILNEGPFDRMIHLGDAQLSEGELYEMAKCPVDVVAGNNDIGLYLPKEKIVEISGHKILLIHGHLKGVNYGMERLINYGIEKGVDIVMFGHTHVPFIKELPEITLINPGSISLPRQSSRKPTWVLMEVNDNGDVNFHFNELK